MVEPPERIHIPVRRDLLARIDDFRRLSRDIPSRAEAIRRLIENGLRHAPNGEPGKPNCSGEKP